MAATHMQLGRELRPDVLGLNALAVGPREMQPTGQVAVAVKGEPSSLTWSKMEATFWRAAWCLGREGEREGERGWVRGWVDGWGWGLASWVGGLRRQPYMGGPGHANAGLQHGAAIKTLVCAVKAMMMITTIVVVVSSSSDVMILHRLIITVVNSMPQHYTAVDAVTHQGVDVTSGGACSRAALA